MPEREKVCPAVKRGRGEEGWREDIPPYHQV